MFENIPLLVGAYLGIGVLLTFTKMWRIAFWCDYLYLQEPRGPEVDELVNSTTLRQYYGLPYPGFWIMLMLTLGWPITVVIGSFSGIGFLVMGVFMIIGILTVIMIYFTFQVLKYAGLLLLILIVWPFTHNKKTTTPQS